MAVPLILGGFPWAGTTANRPTSPDQGQVYYDTTLGALIVWTGTAWANVLTSSGGFTQIVSSATPSVDIGSYSYLDITALAVAITGITVTGTPVDGQKLIIRIKDNGGSQNLTFGSSFENCGATIPSATTAGKRHTLGFIYDSTAAKWGCVAAAVEA